MEQPGSANISWTCPSCGRRVPRRVDACRCGFAHAETSADEPIERSDRPHRSGSDSNQIVFLSLLVIVAGGIVACSCSVRAHQSRPRQQPHRPARCAGLAAYRRRGARSRGLVNRQHRPEPGQRTGAAARHRVTRGRRQPRPAGCRVDHSRTITWDRLLHQARSSADQRTRDSRSDVGDAAGWQRDVQRASDQTVSTGSDLALLQVLGANPNQPVLTMGSGRTRVSARKSSRSGQRLACSRIR